MVYSVLPDGFTPDHYVEIFSEAPEFMMNTLLYASLAATIDIILGTSIAYLVLRSKIQFRHWLDYAAMVALAVPGLVLGIGYLRTFLGGSIPFWDAPLATWWVMLVIALSIRRLPYALRACTSALQQALISLIELLKKAGVNIALRIPPEKNHQS